MRRSTIVVLAGIGVAGLTLGVGYLNTDRLEKKQIALQRLCETQSVEEKLATQGSNARSIRSGNPFDQFDTVTATPVTVENIAKAIIRADAAHNINDVRTLALGIVDLENTQTKAPPLPSGFTLDANPQVATALQGLWTQYQPASAWPGLLICKAEELEHSGQAPGIQGAIQKAYEAKIASSNWPLPTALIACAIALLYWFWYFFLRRIAELRAAFTGSPPNH